MTFRERLKDGTTKISGGGGGGGGGGGTVDAVVAGSHISVDNTDPTHPVISVTGVVLGVVAGSNVSVDNTDPTHPVVSASFTETLPVSIIDAKGDLIVGSADNVAVRKAVGTNNQMLLADSTATGGVKWADLRAKTLPFKISGTLVTGVGNTLWYNDTPDTLTILSIRASVETAPTGGSVVVDFNKNGVTVFTTQANRPTITTGNLTSGKVTNMDVTSVAPGDYLSVDIDTVTNPAAQLTVLVTFR